MRDTELYRQILGIESPWTVDRVDLNTDKGRVDVYVEHKQGVSWSCPECQKVLACRDHAEERSWRHLDTCQYQTLLHARIPRVECPDHGVLQVRVPWAMPGSRFTLLFERLIIDWLKEASVDGVASHLGLKWDAVRGVQSRAVQRGLERRGAAEYRKIGLDEKSFQRRHDYVTVVSDLVKGTVLFVADDRKRQTIEKFWAEEVTEAQKSQIEAVVMDMWDPYVDATRSQVPGADSKIVFDRFHVVRHLNMAIDKIRRAEHVALRSEGDLRLKGTKFHWLRNRSTFKREAWREFRSLRESNLKVARAWAMKQTFNQLWDYKYVGAAVTFFKRWYFWATHSGLQPMIDKAKMIKARLSNILTYLKYRVTNATTEGLNSKIQWIRYTARGFRSREHFKMAIYFHCGGLDLYPR